MSRVCVRAYGYQCVVFVSVYISMFAHVCVCIYVCVCVCVSVSICWGGE